MPPKPLIASVSWATLVGDTKTFEETSAHSSTFESAGNKNTNKHQQTILERMFFLLVLTMFAYSKLGFTLVPARFS